LAAAGIRLQTVNNHLSNFYAALGLAGALEAAYLLSRQGPIEIVNACPCRIGSRP
jgi:hypothetical protein